MFDVVIGQGLHGVGSNGTAAAGFRSRYSAVRLLSSDRTDEEENTYATAGLGGLSLPFLPHTPDFLCGGRSTAVICD